MNSDKSNPRIYIITSLVIVFVFVIMFVLLNIATNASKRKQNYAPTTTTKRVEEPVVVTNLNTSLALIIGDLKFNGNYDHEVRYSGAKFNFKCDKYDEEKNSCIAGSAKMDVGTANLDLFSYENEDDNFFDRSEEFYIIVNDDYIVLVLDNQKSSGKAIILTRNGEKIMEITDIVTKYKLKDEIYKFAYPSIEDGKFNYFKCDSSKVKIVGLDLNKKEDLKVYQNIEGAICN